MSDGNEIPLTLAAQKLAISYERARRLLCIGTLKGRQIPGSNRWVVTQDSVERERGRRADQQAAAAV